MAKFFGPSLVNSTRSGFSFLFSAAIKSEQSFLKRPHLDVYDLKAIIQTHTKKKKIPIYIYISSSVRNSIIKKIILYHAGHL